MPRLRNGACPSCGHAPRGRQRFDVAIDELVDGALDSVVVNGAEAMRDLLAWSWRVQDRIDRWGAKR